MFQYQNDLFWGAVWLTHVWFLTVFILVAHKKCFIKLGQLWRCRALEVLCTLFQEVRVQALQRSLCCVLGQDTFTFTVYHPTQFYKCVLVNLMLGVTLQWLGVPTKEEFKSTITSFTETRLSSEL